MRRRRKHRRFDIKSVGRSTLIPYDPNETKKERHDRRLRENLANRQKLIDWCGACGIQGFITNEGHHWRFVREKKLAEWWPSSAKLVKQKNWNRGIHVHDYEQAKRLLGEYFEIEELKGKCNE